MSRLPFDPDKMRAKEETERARRGAGAPVPGADASAPLTVSQLAAAVDSALRDGVPGTIRVIGEVSNFTDRTHWYFALKDAGAVVSCVMFKSAAARVAFTPTVGHEVVATGRVEFFPPQGRLTFRVEKIEPVGAGALELAYRRLCEELRALGWFDQARKRPLPGFPRRVAVVTSRTGAALQDVLDTLRRRAPFVEVCLIDTLVQGAAAAPAIAQAVDWASANAARLGLEALILTRGGGSMEDLWAFNDRAVAEAVLRCSIPVAAAIGHETDTTIAELVADARCATPTQAAMRCSPDAGALREQAEALMARLSAGLRAGVRRASQGALAHARHMAAAVQRRVAIEGRRTEQSGARLERQRPAAVYEARRARVETAAQQLAATAMRRTREAETTPMALELARACRLAVARQTDRVAALARALDLVGPASVLARGFSLTLGPGGTPLRRAADVQPGDHLETRLAEGTVRSTVSGLSDTTRRHGEPTRRRQSPREADRGPGLFG